MLETAPDPIVKVDARPPHPCSPTRAPSSCSATSARAGRAAGRRPLRRAVAPARDRPLPRRDRRRHDARRVAGSPAAAPPGRQRVRARAHAAVRDRSDGVVVDLHPARRDRAPPLRVPAAPPRRPRPPDRAAQPPPLRGGARRDVAARPLRRRAAASTSTASSTSTTRTATAPATSSCATIGRALTRRVATTDVVARLGGDEFAVLLNGADRARPSGSRTRSSQHGRAAARSRSAPWPCRSPPASASCSFGDGRPARRRRCSRPPTWRCTPPRRRAATASTSTPATTSASPASRPA